MGDKLHKRVTFFLFDFEMGVERFVNVTNLRGILYPGLGASALCFVTWNLFVAFVPRIVFPQGIQTPEYLIDGDRFDLKFPVGRGKNVMYGLIAKKRRQADN